MTSTTDRLDSSTTDTALDHVDVVVIGAGLSGIGAGYRLSTEHPDKSWLILEARDSIGGTWDLFRYPGVRSDSDMFTLGFQFKPWRNEKSIADGDTILAYIKETAAEFGIDERIRFGTKVVGADFSTADAMWTLTLEVTDASGTTRKEMTCGFLYCCAGYYDYDQGYRADITGLDSFAGQVVHPQFWPEDLDYAGKNVVVIGSGATAVTLVPSMASEAGHVTMLQRSPTWISAIPGRDKLADRIRANLPAPLAHKVIRTKNILFSTAFYQFCRRRPEAARRLLTNLSTKILRDEQLVAEHFTPKYDPWDQRLCAIPDADLFKAMRKGTASVVTDRIRTVTASGIELESGKTLPADVIVTATGLQLRALGGIAPRVDGKTVALSEQFVWQGAMITGVPNFSICIGYTNASWTLRADLTSRLVCKVLTYMDDRDLASVVPSPNGPLEEQPLLDLQAGYVQRSIDAFPRQGSSGPWRVRQNYIIDSITTLRADLSKTLKGTPRSAVRRRAGVA